MRVGTVDCKSVATKSAEQWKTTIDLLHMNLIIFPASACPPYLSVQAQLWFSLVQFACCKTFAIWCISPNPTCTQGDSLLLSVSTIVSKEYPLTKECPPPTVHAQLHNFHLTITECVFVSSHFEVPSLMIQISMALLSYLSTLFHGFICLSASEILESTPTSQTEEISLPST